MSNQITPVPFLWELAEAHKSQPVAWPGAGDQPSISRQLSHLGIAIELIQVRVGYKVQGRTTATGVKIVGTDEAIKEEFELFGELRGERGKKVRERMQVVKGDVRMDMKSGKARKNMDRLGYL